MKENSLTEVVFILDRSGSMSGLEDDTIGGFNSILKKQREEDGDANVTTILFDQEIEMLHKRINIKDIRQGLLCKGMYSFIRRSRICN